MHKLLKPFLFLLVGSAVLTACNDNDPEPENEEELITTLTMRFTPVGGGSTLTATFKDLDGDGGNPPTISPITLAKNTTYAVALELLNEAASPAEDITEEVKEEAEEHQFFFQVTNGVGTFTYTDTDANGKPIGLASQFRTSANAGTGTIKVTLRHEPDKNAAGVATGDITNAKGETDIETTFNVTILN